MSETQNRTCRRRLTLRLRGLHIVNIGVPFFRSPQALQDFAFAERAAKHGRCFFPSSGSER
jgi:hypothetical protein